MEHFKKNDIFGWMDFILLDEIKATNLRQTSGEDLAVVLVALAIFCVVHGGVFGHFVFG